MGMSASQARLIALTARMNDVEYQGQQINQQRVTLSNQTNALYNQLLEMDVPTPPSKSDFTRVEYSGKLGTTTYRFSTSDVKPKSNGKYNVTLGYTDYGNSLQRNNGYKTTKKGAEPVKGNYIDYNKTLPGTETRKPEGYIPSAEQPESGTTPALAEGEIFFKPATPSEEELKSGKYYVMDETGKGFVPAGQGNVDNETGPYFEQCKAPDDTWSDGCIRVGQETTPIECIVDTPPETPITDKNVDNLYVINSDGFMEEATQGRDYSIEGGQIKLMPGKNYFMPDENSDKTADKAVEGSYTIEGCKAIPLEEYGKTCDPGTYAGYLEAIENFGLTDRSGNPYGPEHFVVYEDKDGDIHFALDSDMKDNNTCVTYDYNPTGAFTRNQPYEDAKLTFDPATGRITAVDIPLEKDANGNVLGWSTIELSAATVTDDVAYEDAFNDYTYEKDMYDRKQQELNQQTSIIQQQDKNLELKLTRLDNERNALKTEMDAVKEVVKNAIEKGFKTFSG